MAENILFYGFVTSCIIYGIFTFLVKAILKSNGYQVVIFNIDFSDFKNLRSLAMQEKKYRFLYLAYLIQYYTFIFNSYNIDYIISLKEQ